MLPTEVPMGKRRRHGKGHGPSPAAAKADGPGEPGRFSARRKTETILRLLRGEPLDGVALAVNDGGVDRDEIDARSEDGRLLPGRHGHGTARREKERGSNGGTHHDGLLSVRL